MKYLRRRLAHGILLLIGASVLCFLFTDLAPGSFFDEIKLNPQISPETVAALRSHYGLDQPTPVRYALWVKSVLKGEWGYSFAYNSPVSGLLMVRARNTLLLTGAATLLVWLIAVPLGIWLADHRGGWSDRFGMGSTAVLLSVPELVLILGFLCLAVRTHALPVGGMASVGFDQFGRWSKFRDFVTHLIDTGVDITHPVLKNSLVTGYDFTRGQSGGSEDADVTQSTVAVLDNRQPAKVSQSTVAVLDQSSVAVLDGPQYAAFGHGTMVSGIVHLVAPQAKIMPLKSFHADGTGYNSDILNAIYYAVNHGARVINMSFNYSNSSQELANAVNYANSMGVVCVAAAGNDGQQVTVYPAALKNVIDVAATGNSDIRSTFSNYGAPPVWLTAPGEGIMTTYPFGTWAAGWGTSFSAPLVSGTTALLISTSPTSLSLKSVLQGGGAKTQAGSALSHAQPISDPQMGYGRLDTYQAMQAWRKAMGLK